MLIAPCMILFCEFEQQFKFIELGKQYGLPNYINLVFRKNFSPQVLKANMKIVGNCEYGLLFYRNKLPKFNNRGKMIFNCIDWERDTDTPKVHPTQKPVPLLKKLIDLFTDVGDVVIDPCCGSGTTLLAAQTLDRKSYGFEVDRNFFNDSINKLLGNYQPDMFQALKYDKNRRPIWIRPLRECKNLEKQNRKIRLIHKRLTDIRNNYLHQTTSEIVKTKPSQIVMEDLNVKGMMKNKYLSEAIAKQKFYEFKRQIQYKSEMYGIKVIKADRFYASSKTCSHCGHVKKDLKLSDRIYVCPVCGAELDRDLNAAVNLANYKTA